MNMEASPHLLLSFLGLVKADARTNAVCLAGNIVGTASAFSRLVRRRPLALDDGWGRSLAPRSLSKHSTSSRSAPSTRGLHGPARNPTWIFSSTLTMSAQDLCQTGNGKSWIPYCPVCRSCSREHNTAPSWPKVHTKCDVLNSTVFQQQSATSKCSQTFSSESRSLSTMSCRSTVSRGSSVDRQAVEVPR